MIMGNKKLIGWLFLSFISLSVQADKIILCSTCETQIFAEAYKKAAPCDTIEIIGGHHRIENFIIDKSITLIGIDYPQIISASGSEIFTVAADDVTIEGLCFKGVKTSYMKEHAAIRILERKHFKILNNRIDSCFFGLYLQHAKDGLVSGNVIIGNATTEAESGNGIHAWYCDKLEINNNLVEGNRDGIYLEFVNNSTVNNNISRQNKRYGLHFMFSNDDSYIDNEFQNNGVGVAVMFSRRIKMIGNRFAFNWGGSSYGLLLKEIYDAEISNNNFDQNTMGIFVEGSNRVNYFKNTFNRNGWAIKFSGGCEDNTIHYNNFINNSLDLVISSSLNSNSIHHNYWSNYSGYDLDKDDIGDVPYYPVKLFYYIIDQTPEAIVLMRSLFVDIINFAERVSPIFTPKDIFDNAPLMKKAI
jgi:nitrous oxidase accessory protein